MNSSTPPNLPLGNVISRMFAEVDIKLLFDPQPLLLQTGRKVNSISRLGTALELRSSCIHHGRCASLVLFVRTFSPRNVSLNANI